MFGLVLYFLVALTVVVVVLLLLQFDVVAFVHRFLCSFGADDDDEFP